MNLIIEKIFFDVFKLYKWKYLTFKCFNFPIFAKKAWRQVIFSPEKINYKFLLSIIFSIISAVALSLFLLDELIKT